MVLRSKSLKIKCHNCNRVLTYSEEPPRFCQDCGEPLQPADDPNGSIEPEEDLTIAPQQPNPGGEFAINENDRIDHYRMIRWLGSGGMGTVWEAVDENNGRRVAIKRNAESMGSDETYVKRFIREAQLAAQVSHPNVTFIYGAGNEAGQPYIAMELMPGNTLADLVSVEGSLACSAAVDHVIGIVDGLIAVHEQGMIHRDVKPANCFLDSNGNVKIGDFGLSKSTRDKETGLTKTGTFMGTPSYAAPEQIRGDKVDGRSDLYSVGATLFFLLTGRTPFLGDAMSVTAQVIADRAPICSEINPTIPKDLGRVVAKCLEKDPSKRFQTLESLRLALIPFATKRESISDVGRRLAAYMIDQAVIQIVLTLVISTIAVAMIFQGAGVQFDEDKVQRVTKSVGFWGVTLSWLLTTLYFTFCEGWFGRGVGKRLMMLNLIDSEGQRPGALRAFARSAILPGGLGVPLVFTLWNASGSSPTATVEVQLQIFMRDLAASYIPCLICVSTMRASNRFLGIHGMLTGTRVIRLNQGKQKFPIPVIVPTLTAVESLKFGPYETKELIGESKYGKVYLSKDDTLNRNVWIVVHTDETDFSVDRMNLARDSRQRWLDCGLLDDGQRWDAFESIEGVPVHIFVGLQNNADWSLYGQVMLDIVIEIQAAIKDRTLPKTISLSLVWLNQAGQGKLIDKQLVNPIENNPLGTYEHPQSTRADIDNRQQIPVEDAVVLVQELGELFQRTQIFPNSVQDFLTELQLRPKTVETLQWAEEQLLSRSNSISNLTWDGRLGVLSATLGIELVLYSLVSSVAFLACFFFVPASSSYCFSIGLALSLILPVLFSWRWCGGPVFQVMGIEVCNIKGKKASGLICSIRSIISWAPIFAIIGVVVLMQLYRDQANGLDPPKGTLATLETDPIAQFKGDLIVYYSLICLALGVVIAIVKPKRGIADLLLRTRLMPK